MARQSKTSDLLSDQHHPSALSSRLLQRQTYKIYCCSSSWLRNWSVHFQPISPLFKQPQNIIRSDHKNHFWTLAACDCPPFPALYFPKNSPPLSLVFLSP